LQAAAILQEQKQTRDFKRRKAQMSVSSKEDIENYYLSHKRQPSDASLDNRESRSLSRATTATVQNLNVPEMITDTVENVPEITGLTKEDVRLLFSLIEAITMYSMKLEVSIICTKT
jgi:hypothetical protein